MKKHIGVIVMVFGMLSFGLPTLLAGYSEGSHGMKKSGYEESLEEGSHGHMKEGSHGMAEHIATLKEAAKILKQEGHSELAAELGEMAKMKEKM